MVSNAYNAATNPDGCIQLGLADNQVGSLPMHPPRVFMGQINQGPSLPLLILCLVRAAVLRPPHHQTPAGSRRIPTGLCGLPGFQRESSISPGKESALCIFLISNLNHCGGRVEMLVDVCERGPRLLFRRPWQLCSLECSGLPPPSTPSTLCAVRGPQP